MLRTLRATLRTAGLIAGNDLRRRLRSRSFVLQAIVGPVVLSILVSLAFGGGFGFSAKVGVLDLDRSDLSTGFQQTLLDSKAKGIEFVAVTDRLDAERKVAAGTLDSAIVVPPGFEASLATATPEAVEVVTDREHQIGAVVARSVAGGFTSRVNAARLATFVLLADGRPAPDPTSLTDLELPVSIDQRTTGDTLTPGAAIGPGMGLLFLFLSVAVVARNLLEEQRLRVLDRVRAAPVSVTSILLGKCAGVVLLGCVTMCVLWGMTTLLLGAQWGAPAGVMLLIVTSALAVAGIAGVIAALAKTEQSADTYATMVAFVFGIVGGSLVPLSQLPPALLRLSLLTPNGWALHGFAELSAGEGTIADVLPHAGVLLIWAVVSGALASVLLPRRMGAR